MTIPLPKFEDSSESGSRAETRTHLFLVAMFCSDAIRTSVRIRNLSSSGALIEGSGLPSVGTVFSICRANLSAEGVLVWRSENQAGVSFKSSVSVSDWLPKNSRSAQCKADQMVFELKNNRSAAPQGPDLGSGALNPNAILAELSSLRSDLASLADRLVQDIILVATHPEIQTLDIAIQKVDRILARIIR